jgi:hypothetical protein
MSVLIAPRSMRSGSRRVILEGVRLACDRSCQKMVDERLTIRSTRDVLVSNKQRTSGTNGGTPLCGPPRGSWAGRFPEGRLRGVLPKASAEFGRTPLLAHGVACPLGGQTGAPRQARASIPEPARPEPTGQGARPTGSGAVSRLWSARAGCCVDQMGEVGAVIPATGRAVKSQIK